MSNTKERLLTIADVDQAVAEKLEHYSDWYTRGIISREEYEQTIIVLEGVKRLLTMRSHAPRQKEIA